ncbi:MAG: hypothetical protein IJA34_08485 [Lachnospiraceae bacterium]|nr:hypothetical protein [Lachnospiraceae bacterium]
MDKFIKCFYILTIIAGSIFIGINVVKNNKNVDFVSTYNSDDKNKNLEYVTIQEIRDTKEEVIRELEDGKYTNLIADDMYVSISSEDEVCNMYEYAPGLFHGITDPMEIHNMQMDLIKYYLGEDLLEECICDANSIYEDTVSVDGGWLLRDYKEVYKHLKEGTYDQICSRKVYGYSLPNITYSAYSNVEGDNRYAHFLPDFSKTMVIKGKVIEMSEQPGMDPASEYEALAIYYPEGENIYDEYELQNSKISIREAINFVEDYFKNKLPYDISIGAEKKVAKVAVYELSEGKICLEFYIVRIINGMETEYSSSYGMGGPGTYIDEICPAMMVDVDDIDQYILLNNTLKFEKEGKSVSEVVSLESALQCVSDKIGKNSIYNVTEARMSYRRKIINDRQFENEYECIPCWIIRCENQVDGRETRFYINLINGNIDYKTSYS